MPHFQLRNCPARKLRIVIFKIKYAFSSFEAYACIFCLHMQLKIVREYSQSHAETHRLIIDRLSI